MAKLDQQRLTSVVQPHLEHGEQLRNTAVAIRKPSFFLIIPLIVLAVLPGLIAQALLTKYFIVVLTDRRFLILRYKGNLEVQEVTEYRLGQVPPSQTNTGVVFVNLTLMDPRGKFFCQFHRANAVGNREQALAIVSGIQAGGSAAAPFSPPPRTAPLTLPLTASPVAARTAPPPIPAAAAASASIALRIGARRFSLHADAMLREDDIAGLLAQAGDNNVAMVDRNPNNPSILGLKNLSTSPWSVTLPDGEKRQLESGRAVRLSPGTRIGFGFCEGVIET